MSTTTQMTAEELARLPRGRARYELVRGELRTMSPAGAKHGAVAMVIGIHLGQFVLKHKLGRVFAAETGFSIESDPDTVRAADVSFVSLDRLPHIADRPAFAKLAPDLAIEVLSPSDSSKELLEKIQQWLDAGTRAVVAVDPESRKLTIHQLGADAVEIDESESLELPAIVPGWVMPVRDMFEWI